MPACQAAGLVEKQRLSGKESFERVQTGLWGPRKPGAIHEYLLEYAQTR